MGGRTVGGHQLCFPLLLVLLVATAGCLSGSPAYDVAGNETNRDSSNETDECRPTDAAGSTNLTASGVVGHAADESPLSPKPFPDPPANHTRAAVEQFVKSYEPVYLYNSILANETTRIRHKIHHVDSEPTGDGSYDVTIEVGLEQAGTRAGQDWEIGGVFTARYLVNRSVIRRDGQTGSSAYGLDPANGTILIQYPGCNPD